MNPKLIVEQKLTTFTNMYFAYKAQADGSKGEPLSFAQQKKFAFREKIEFFSDDTKSRLVYTLRAERVLDVHGKYFVEDENGKVLGNFQKEFAKSLLNSTWNILDSNGQPKVTLSESNHLLAILRRYGGLVPVVGVFSEIITSLLRYHFNFKDLSSGNIVGKYQKIKLFRDHYLLYMDDTTYSQFDWRLIAALAVGLDALQSR